VTSRRSWLEVAPERLSQEAFEAMVRQPGFRQACEATARNALANYAAEDEATRWLTRDLGRFSLYMSALVLDVRPAGLSVAGLAEDAAANAICSRGRVVAFVSYAQRAGRLAVPPGSEPWTQRRLIVQPAFRQYASARLHGAFDALSDVAPDVAAARAHLGDPRALAIGLTIVAQVAQMRRDLLGPFPVDPIGFFLQREGGIRMLQILLLGQAADRSRLLESAPLHRADLARRAGISRPHLNRTLAAAEAAGHLSVSAHDRVTFSEALSEDLGLHFARLFQLHRVLAHAILDTCACG
jgi:hypothetical protein